MKEPMLNGLVYVEVNTCATKLRAGEICFVKEVPNSDIHVHWKDRRGGYHPPIVFDPRGISKENIQPGMLWHFWRIKARIEDFLIKGPVGHAIALFSMIPMAIILLAVMKPLSTFMFKHMFKTPHPTALGITQIMMISIPVTTWAIYQVIRLNRAVEG